jgi:xanthosine utilization system XapX-like protein
MVGIGNVFVGGKVISVIRTIILKENLDGAYFLNTYPDD